MTLSEIFSIIQFHLGLIAQSVEQRIENPCVGSSILPQATINLYKLVFDFCLALSFIKGPLERK